MRFRFNGNIITAPEPEADVVAFFQQVFGMIADDGDWQHPDTGQVWKKVGNLNRCFVLTNPQQTFTTRRARAAVLRNAYHIAAAFPQADVYCPLNNQIAQQIVVAVEPGNVRVHFQVRYVGE